MLRLKARRISGNVSTNTCRLKKDSLNCGQYADRVAARKRSPSTNRVLSVASATPFAPSSRSENPPSKRDRRSAGGNSGSEEPAGWLTRRSALARSLGPDRDLADVGLLREPLGRDRLQGSVGLHLL